MRRITGVIQLEEYSRDAGLQTVVPRIAYVAESEGDVAEALGEADSLGIPVTARGGGTGIPSQSVGRGAIILQESADATVAGELVSCGPAITKGDLNAFLKDKGRWSPVDPSSYASCTVGGMVANNSSGARTLKYGSTVDYVERLRVVVPKDGAIAVGPVALEEAGASDPRTRRLASLLLDEGRAIEEDLRDVTKNSSGYRLERCIHDGLFDLAKLFVGSEGTLGVTTQAVLRTVEPPSWRVLFTFEASLGGLDGLASVLRGLGPSALEIVDKSVFSRVGRRESIAPYSKTEDPYLIFCEFDGRSGSAESAIDGVSGSPAAGYEPVVLTDQPDIQRAWELRNETLTVAGEIREDGKTLVPGVEDLVVPPQRLGDLVRLLVDQFGRRGLDYILYGHAGDANLHSRPLMDLAGGGKESLRLLMQDCFDGVWKMGGSMTGEHGDGRMRAGFLEQQYPRTYWIMKEVKSLFDPKGMMNPGVKLP